MTAIVKIKLMPSSVDENFKNLKWAVKKIVENGGGENINFEEEPIAFGLKALIIFFLWSEEKELESLEKELGEIEEVNSVEVLDIRKALG